MKTLKMAVLAMLMVAAFSTVSSALASSSVVSGNTLLYEIAIPEVNNPKVVTEFQEYSSLCEEQTILYRYYSFSLPVKTSKLTKWNFGTTELSGIGNNENNGRSSNLTGYLSFIPGVAYITFAGQQCQQNFTQEYNYTTEKWECIVEKEFSCYDVEYYIQQSSKVVLAVEPYSQAK